MELLADRDPEEARKLLDPVARAHDGGGPPLRGHRQPGDGRRHHGAVRRAARPRGPRRAGLLRRAADAGGGRALRRGRCARTHGVDVQIRVGLNSGEVVVRSIGNDLHMDYTAVGQTTHLAARMEQLATPGTILPDRRRRCALAEGYVQVEAARARSPVKGLAEPVEVFELSGAGTARTRLQAAAARGLTRFVGREAELEQLRQALEQAGARARPGRRAGRRARASASRGCSTSSSTRIGREGWLVLESGSVSYGKATPLPAGDRPAQELLRDRGARRRRARSARR